MAEPLRSCVACRRRAPKGELRRIVRSPDGEIAWDPTGKAPGRGAYVCREVRCFNRARGRLPTALRTTVPAEAIEKLREGLEGDT